jgi:hypothetical protein
MSLSQFMADLKRTVQYFSKSNISVAKLQKAHQETSTSGGLIKIGKTHFATHWTSSVALDKNLSLIKELISDGTLKPKVRKEVK